MADEAAAIDPVAEKEPFDIEAVPVSAEVGAIPRVKIKEYSKVKDRNGNIIEIPKGSERNVTLADLRSLAANLSARLNIVNKQIAAAEELLPTEE